MSFHKKRKGGKEKKYICLTLFRMGFLLMQLLKGSQRFCLLSGMKPAFLLVHWCRAWVPNPVEWTVKKSCLLLRSN